MENEETRKIIKEEICTENNKLLAKFDDSVRKINYLEEKLKKIEERCIDLNQGSPNFQALGPHWLLQLVPRAKTAMPQHCIL